MCHRINHVITLSTFVDRLSTSILFPMARTARGDLGHGTARETMSRMPVVQIQRRIRTPRGISTDSCCCLQPLVLSAVRPSVYYRCLLVPHSVTQLLEQRWTCSSKHALTGCLLSLHLRMSLALGSRTKTRQFQSHTKQNVFQHLDSYKKSKAPTKNNKAK